MSQIEISEAASNLQGWVARARSGEEVVLVDGGLEVARIVRSGPGSRISQPVQLGRLRGQFRIPDEFEAPLPDDLLDSFEGAPCSEPPLPDQAKR